MESDGMEEAISGQLRVLVTAASQVGQTISRWREEQARKAEQMDIQQAREMQSRIEAERQVARMELARSNQPDWWERATPEQIAHTYQVAVAWKATDPEAARAEHHMRRELHTRYGIDVNNTGADPALVREAVIAAQNNLDVGKQEGEATRDRTEAQQLLTAAGEEEAREREAERDGEVPSEEPTSEQMHHEAQLAHDSAERREHTAARLTAQGIDPTVVRARMLADVSQGKPAIQVVKLPLKRVTRARKRRSQFVRTRSRAGLAR